jgi:hypothetical protein
VAGAKELLRGDPLESTDIVVLLAWSAACLHNASFVSLNCQGGETILFGTVLNDHHHCD